MKRTTGLLLLALASCATTPDDPRLVAARELPTDYAGLVLAALEAEHAEHMSFGEPYCLRLFGDPVPRDLKTYLQTRGHPTKTCGQFIGLDVYSIEMKTAVSYSVVMLEQCGVLCGVGVRYDLGLGENRNISVLDAELVMEF